MKPEKMDDNVYLSHIYQQTTFLIELIQKISHSEFVENILYMNAIARSLEIIGEAGKKISEEFREEHPEIPWRLMAGNRDKLIHGYFVIDYDIVWATINDDIPLLHKQIESLVPDIKSEQK